MAGKKETPLKANVEFLLRRAQAGDKKAFEELVLIYQDKVYSLSYHLAGNREDAEDLAQEAFVRAYLGLRSFRQEADFGTWLHRITVNAWLNMKRSREAQVLSLDNPKRTPEGWQQREFPSQAGSGNPGEALGEKELQLAVWEALQKLSPEFRTVLVLREIEGYSYEEIAAMTKASLGTVKSRLSRARNALKELVAPLLEEKEGAARGKAGENQ